MTTSIEMGRYLAHIREKAGLKQNELAHRVEWSPAFLSRAESGDRPLSDTELRAVLDAIGTPEALRLQKTSGRVWQELERPALGHPDEEILWRAENAIRSIDELSENPDVTHLFAKRLDEFRYELTTVAALVAKTEYNIAFLGKIGIGKSTAICRIAGLEVVTGGKVEPVLEVGGGGTTVCEVRIMQGDGYNLHIEPVDADEFHREVLEFARFLARTQGPDQEQEDGDRDAQGTSTEIVRVIRNMSGLITSRHRLPDGKREVIDPAKDLAAQFTDPDALAGEILAKIGMHRRTRHHLRYPEISGKEPLQWLKETFGQVNKGQHPECALPKRVDIIVPNGILGTDSPSVCLVDTKGIFATAERADLESHFGDDATVVVLCSSFNDAPSTEVQQLLKRADAGGFPNLDSKSAILVLPRSEEALAVKDDQGMPADTVADGYDMKSEQAETRLKSENIPYADIAFFNSREDDSAYLVSFLSDRIEGIRAIHRENLGQIIAGANALVENFAQEQVQEIYQQAARRMLVWLDNNRSIEAPATRLEAPLLSAIAKAYAASVHASVRRQGDWYNLDYSHHLGYGARAFTGSIARPNLRDFQAITTNLLQDCELEPAYGLIRQALRILESEVDSILTKSESLGERIYIEYLEPDAEFWNRCEREWGMGYGYRDRVLEHNREWFAGDGRDYQAMLLELVRREWRRIRGRLLAILDTGALDAGADESIAA